MVCFHVFAKPHSHQIHESYTTSALSLPSSLFNSQSKIPTMSGSPVTKSPVVHPLPVQLLTKCFALAKKSTPFLSSDSTLFAKNARGAGELLTRDLLTSDLDKDSSPVRPSGVQLCASRMVWRDEGSLSLFVAQPLLAVFPHQSPVTNHLSRVTCHELRLSLIREESLLPVRPKMPYRPASIDLLC